MKIWTTFGEKSTSQSKPPRRTLRTVSRIRWLYLTLLNLTRRFSGIPFQLKQFSAPYFRAKLIITALFSCTPQILFATEFDILIDSLKLIYTVFVRNSLIDVGRMKHNYLLNIFFLVFKFQWFLIHQFCTSIAGFNLTATVKGYYYYHYVLLFICLFLFFIIQKQPLKTHLPRTYCCSFSLCRVRRHVCSLFL